MLNHIENSFASGNPAALSFHRGLRNCWDSTCLSDTCRAILDFMRARRLRCWGFFGYRPNFFLNDRKRLCRFDHNVRKYRPVNTVTASFYFGTKEFLFWDKLLFWDKGPKYLREENIYEVHHCKVRYKVCEPRMQSQWRWSLWPLVTLHREYNACILKLISICCFHKSSCFCYFPALVNRNHYLKHPNPVMESNQDTRQLSNGLL